MYVICVENEMYTVPFTARQVKSLFLSIAAFWKVRHTGCVHVTGHLSIEPTSLAVFFVAPAARFDNDDEDDDDIYS